MLGTLFVVYKNRYCMFYLYILVSKNQKSFNKHLFKQNKYSIITIACINNKKYIHVGGKNER